MAIAFHYSCQRAQMPRHCHDEGPPQLAASAFAFNIHTEQAELTQCDYQQHDGVLDSDPQMCNDDCINARVISTFPVAFPIHEKCRLTNELPVAGCYRFSTISAAAVSRITTSHVVYRTKLHPTGSGEGA